MTGGSDFRRADSDAVIGGARPKSILKPLDEVCRVRRGRAPAASLLPHSPSRRIGYGPGVLLPECGPSY
jgi:hypothetical protein